MLIKILSEYSYEIGTSEKEDCINIPISKIEEIGYGKKFDIIGKKIIEDLDYEKRIKNRELKNKIEILKMELSNMDYKTMKYIEGQISEEEFNEVKKQKEKIRETIKNLEKQLNN